MEFTVVTTKRHEVHAAGCAHLNRIRKVDRDNAWRVDAETRQELAHELHWQTFLDEDIPEDEYLTILHFANCTKPL